MSTKYVVVATNGRWGGSYATKEEAQDRAGELNELGYGLWLIKEDIDESI